MDYLGLSFGKKHRAHKRHGKVAKPPAKLLRICKKYRVKATKKVGGKRVYKKVSVLKKLCLRKARALKKKLMKAHKKSIKHHKRRAHPKRRSHHKRRAHPKRRSDFGEDEEREMMFGRRRRSAFGEDCKMNTMFGRQSVPMFGKKRHAKVSKKAAMKAFRSFYKRHCAGRRSGFGNGGNPPLNQSMGYEFCPDGRGGVLGFNSTGLFPSPCTPYSSSAPTMAALPPPTKVSEGGFGRRRNVKRRNVKRRTTTIGARKRRSTTIGARKRRV